MMADPRRMRREQERREHKRIRTAVLAEARGQGCVCNPELHLEWREDHWYSRAVHPHWCPASTMLAERGLIGERRLLLVPSGEAGA